MAFVTDYEHDIFVSYASVDDQTLPGVTDGWVTTLVKALTTKLEEKLGRKGACDVWMDPALNRHLPVTPTLTRKVQKSATMLVLLSPGYLKSDWCSKERAAFLDIERRVRPDSRVFIVEKVPIIPVRIDDVDPPLGFKQIQAADLREADRGGYRGHPTPEMNAGRATTPKRCRERGEKVVAMPPRSKCFRLGNPSPLSSEVWTSVMMA